jgi:hypothetical protein
MKSILNYVDIGRKEGATLTTGGGRVGERGYFVSPAVFADVKHEMRIWQEEIFGPVVSVIKFKDEADALYIANGTAYSLAAGVWSRDIGRVQRFAKKANAGTVWINTYGYTDVRLPLTFCLIPQRLIFAARAPALAILRSGRVLHSATIATDLKPSWGYSGGDAMEWDPEILARLRSSREETSLQLKERNRSPRAPSQPKAPEIKMVVGKWYTDELGNRARMIYNAKTVDFEALYGVSREVSTV